MLGVTKRHCEYCECNLPYNKIGRDKNKMVYLCKSCRMYLGRIMRMSGIKR